MDFGRKEGNEGWKNGKVWGYGVSLYLGEWDELTEEIKQYDWVTVLRIPKILSQARPRYDIVRKKE